MDISGLLEHYESDKMIIMQAIAGKVSTLQDERDDNLAARITNTIAIMLGGS